MQACQLTQEIIRRATELESENLRLLKEGQSGLEKLNTVYAQLLAEQTALQKANKEISKLNGLLDESTKHQEISEKLATDALAHADEAKRKAEEAEGQLAQAKEALEQEKGSLAQQGYDAVDTPFWSAMIFGRRNATAL